MWQTMNILSPSTQHRGFVLSGKHHRTIEEKKKKKKKGRHYIPFYLKFCISQNYEKNNKKKGSIHTYSHPQDGGRLQNNQWSTQGLVLPIDENRKNILKITWSKIIFHIRWNQQKVQWNLSYMATPFLQGKVVTSAGVVAYKRLECCRISIYALLSIWEKNKCLSLEIKILFKIITYVMQMKNFTKELSLKAI